MVRVIQLKVMWNSRAVGSYLIAVAIMMGVLGTEGCEQMAGGVNIFEAVTDSDLEAISRFSTAGGDLNAVNSEGNTPLLCACDDDSEGVFRHLLELGANPNVMTSEARTAVNCAATKESTSWLRAALEHGGSPNLLEAEIPGRPKRSPLLWAINDERFENVRLLIDAGANVSAVNEFGDTPLHYAVDRRRYDIAMYLLEQGADYRHQTPGRTSFIELMGTRRLETLRDPEMRQQLLAVREWLRERGIETEQK